MANYVIQDTTLTGIADAIREKNTGKTITNDIIVGTDTSAAPGATGFDSYNGYGSNLSITDTVTIPGATKIKVKIAYQSESTSYDYVTITPGVGNATDKLGGTTRKEEEYEFSGTDTVSFYFKSDSSNGNYLGYYAEITGYIEEIIDLSTMTYKPNEMAEAIAAIESSGSGGGGFNTSTLNAYLSANYVNDADIDGDINWTTWKSYIKDPVYNPTSKYTSSSGVGDGGTGLQYRLSGFTKMNQIPSVDKIKSIHFWNAYHCYVWFAGMPFNKISDTLITMRACRIYYDSTYSRGYIKGVESDNTIGLDLQNNYFYQNFTSSISSYQMMIVYED